LILKYTLGIHPGIQVVVGNDFLRFGIDHFFVILIEYILSIIGIIQLKPGVERTIVLCQAFPPKHDEVGLTIRIPAKKNRLLQMITVRRFYHDLIN